MNAVVLLCRPCSELLIALVNAAFSGMKSVMPSAHWSACTALEFVPLILGSCSPESTFWSADPLMAVSAVDRLPGGVRVPLMPLMKRFSHVVLFSTVIFDLRGLKSAREQGRVKRRNVPLVQDRDVTVSGRARPYEDLALVASSETKSDALKRLRPMVTLG